MRLGDGRGVPVADALIVATKVRGGGLGGAEEECKKLTAMAKAVWRTNTTGPHSWESLLAYASAGAGHNPRPTARRLPLFATGVTAVKT
jgi:hypothetical protein